MAVETFFGFICQFEPVFTWSKDAQCVGATQWHKASRLTAACRPDALTWGGCEAGRWCWGAAPLPDRLWPTDRQTDEQTAVLGGPSVSRVTGGLCIRPGPCHRDSFSCPPSHPFTHPPKHTCTLARTHTQFHCDLSPDWIKPKEQRAKPRDCFHKDRRQGLCPLRTSPLFVPARLTWFNQSTTKGLLFPALPPSYPTPSAFFHTDSFHLCPMFSKMPESAIPFFLPLSRH